MNGDLISRRRLLEDLGASCYDLDALTGITGDDRTLQEAILQLPAEDAEWVVRGHIVWKDRQRGGVRKVTGTDEFGTTHTVRYMDFYVERTPYCSVCKKVLGDTFLTFCSSCGARMDAVEVNAYEEGRNDQEHGQAPRDSGSP